MEEERQKHASDAEKMKRKQAKIQEEAVRKQEDAEKVFGGGLRDERKCAGNVGVWGVGKAIRKAGGCRKGVWLGKRGVESVGKRGVGGVGRKTGVGRAGGC
jgi:hypothetical protein